MSESKQEWWYLDRVPSSWDSVKILHLGNRSTSQSVQIIVPMPLCYYYYALAVQSNTFTFTFTCTDLTLLLKRRNLGSDQKVHSWHATITKIQVKNFIFQAYTDWLNLGQDNRGMLCFRNMFPKKLFHLGNQAVCLFLVIYGTNILDWWGVITKIVTDCLEIYIITTTIIV